MENEKQPKKEIKVEKNKEKRKGILTIKKQFIPLYEYLSLSKETIILFIILLYPVIMLDKIGLYLILLVAYNILAFFGLKISKKRSAKQEFIFYQQEFEWVQDNKIEKSKKFQYSYITGIRRKESLLQKAFHLSNIVIYVAVPSDLPREIVLPSLKNGEKKYKEILKITGYKPQ